MSTRSQLRFVDPSGNQVAQVYKHSDGYPSNIIPLLADLRQTVTNTAWQRGPGYAAAQFIFMDKLSGLRFCADKLVEKFTEQDPDTEYEHGLYARLTEQDGVSSAKAEAAVAMADLLTDLSAWERADRPYFLGGHAVETGNIHGDEEYIYEVSLAHNVREDGDTWNVKVSSDFPEPEVELRDGSYRGYDFPEGEDAWTEATWGYEGDLAEAAAVAADAEEVWGALQNA